ncbi:hypothetical protein CC78DRAFT_454011 [Lojkania enalia]|uniref:DUF8021 domain-containing protein n=1 Tax=Lojkania enalia TaxID=147567 RepID=A0A9P4N9Q5_9PLEO|nr:hypothetical protein CC78DRAFT_454011 [Didymosphaeria enalia]
MYTWFLLSILLTISLAAPTSKAACSRATLAAASDAYISAQTAGSLTPLSPVVAPNWTYTENNKSIDPAKGVLVKSLKIDHRRTIYDLVQCATYSEVISVSGPYVIGTQIRHNADGKVVLIDSVASTTGSWLFNAAKTLEYVKQEKWEPIPKEKQDKREVIQAAGDAYMSMWASETAHLEVPWGTPCVRLEGSAYTGSGRPDDSCQPGIPSNHSQADNINRRYVIDEEMGSVSILCLWQHMMNAADSHEFRLENGKLRYVHTMTECGGRPCRL